MRLKLLLKDDPLLRQQLAQCESPDQVMAICAKLQLQISMADLLRMEAQMTLTLTDEQLKDWYETPYWRRVLISVGALQPPEQSP